LGAACLVNTYQRASYAEYAVLHALGGRLQHICHQVGKSADWNFDAVGELVVT
jgi:hypothetical protein